MPGAARTMLLGPRMHERFRVCAPKLTLWKPQKGPTTTTAPCKGGLYGLPWWRRAAKDFVASEIPKLSGYGHRLNWFVCASSASFFGRAPSEAVPFELPRHSSGSRHRWQSAQWGLNTCMELMLFEPTFIAHSINCDSHWS